MFLVEHRAFILEKKVITEENKKVLKELRRNMNCLEDLMEVMDILVPHCQIDEDNDGQIIIYSGVREVHQAGHSDGDRDTVFVRVKNVR